MKAKDIIKQAMKATRVTQEQLRDRLGITSQSVISMRINSENPTVGTLVEILDEIGYELVIQPKKRGRRPEDQEVVTK